ncbi:MAG TPA: AMP-binding protein, partial [Alphaproteobacteria bacterium]|nr:AMP-binding protein [Alphaproteobacteria bacterium]
MTEPATIPQYMLRNEHEIAKLPAMREKDYGIWQTYGWRAYTANVRDFANGLAALGFGRDDKLSVIGNNRPALYWAQLAAMALRGQAVPVYQDAIASELSFVLHHCGAKVIVAEDQEQVDKILSIRDKLPDLEWLIYDDGRGMTNYAQDFLKSFEQVQALGREYA